MYRLCKEMDWSRHLLSSSSTRIYKIGWKICFLFCSRIVDNQRKVFIYFWRYTSNWQGIWKGCRDIKRSAFGGMNIWIKWGLLKGRWKVEWIKISGIVYTYILIRSHKDDVDRLNIPDDNAHVFKMMLTLLYAQHLMQTV